MGDVLRVWRVVILMIGAVDIGMVGYVCWAYMTGRIAPAGAYRKTWHVLFIATSYLLLAAGLWANIAGRAIAGTVITWRLPLATAAYILGIIALTRITPHTKLMKGGQHG